MVQDAHLLAVHIANITCRESKNRNIMRSETEAPIGINSAWPTSIVCIPAEYNRRNSFVHRTSNRMQLMPHTVQINDELCYVNFSMKVGQDVLGLRELLFAAR